MLLKFISAPDLRESSVDCLHEIISKGEVILMLADISYLLLL